MRWIHHRVHHFMVILHFTGRTWTIFWVGFIHLKNKFVDPAPRVLIFPIFSATKQDTNTNNTRSKSSSWNTKKTKKNQLSCVCVYRKKKLGAGVSKFVALTDTATGNRLTRHRWLTQRTIPSPRFFFFSLFRRPIKEGRRKVEGKRWEKIRKMALKKCRRLKSNLLSKLRLFFEDSTNSNSQVINVEDIYKRHQQQRRFSTTVQFLFCFSLFLNNEQHNLNVYRE